MKITLRNKKPLIDIDSFNKKADVIFKDVVIPQIKKYKTMKESKCSYCGEDCNNTCGPVKIHIQIIILFCIIIMGLGFILGILIMIKWLLLAVIKINLI